MSAMDAALDAPHDLHNLAKILPFLVAQARKVNKLEAEIATLKSKLRVVENAIPGLPDANVAEVKFDGNRESNLESETNNDEDHGNDEELQREREEIEALKEMKLLAMAVGEAATEGKVEDVKRLLDSKASLEISGPDGRTPLIVAVEAKQKKVTAFLLEAKADVEGLGDDGRSPLDSALAVANNIGCVKLLLNANATVNEPDASSVYPIFKAIIQNRPKLLALLVQADANLEVTKEEDESTALMMASSCSNTSCVSILIERKAQLDRKNRNGNTALMGACYGQAFECAQMLLNARAGLNFADRNKNTALHLATLGGGLLSLIRLLCEAKADVNVPDSFGDTPLTLAAEMGNIELLAILVGHSGDINHENGDGSTALTLAVQTGNFGCADMLIECKASVAYSNSDGVSPMTVMADEHNSEAVIYLMEHVLESMSWTLMCEARDILHSNKEMELAVLKGCENYEEALSFEIQDAVTDLSEDNAPKPLEILLSYLNPAPVLEGDQLMLWITPPTRKKNMSMSLKDQLQLGAHRLRKAKRQNRVKERVEKKDDMFSGLKLMLASINESVAGEEEEEEVDDDSDFD